MMRNHREVSKCRVVLVGLIISAAPRALAQPYEILHHFAGGTSDGRFPAAALLEGSDGALYGTAEGGGINESGIVFMINKDGTGYTVLKYFDAGSGEGMDPRAALIEGSDGALYGTTAFGGSNNRGTAYTLNKDGTGYAVLVNFGSEPSDGLVPNSGLLEGSDAVLYGTTLSGGSHGNGTLFTVNKDGTGYAVLKNFGDFPGDGTAPYGSVIEGSDGALYGTTYWGGFNGEGTVYTMNKDGSGYAILLSNDSEPFDGMNPHAAVVEGSDGALYGTTLTGEEIEGIAFKVNRDGMGYQILHRFNDFDGAILYAGVVEGSDNALYGTTALGGPGHGGTVYKVSKDGSSFLTLHGFPAFAGDGREPDATVVFGSDGALYGTTVRGGSSEDGVVFRLSFE